MNHCHHPLLHEPAVHANLAVCLLGPPSGRNAENALPAREFLVLEECLANGRARLHETGTVGYLEIENLAEADLFLQAGDIVKGGWQDRALGTDFIVPARSGRISVSAFCVEHGRWSQRQGESAETFGSSPEILSSSKLKRLIRKEQSQAAVWDEVAAVQGRLAASIGRSVAAAMSPSSLPLSLGNADVRRRTEGYVATLGSLPDAHPAAVGFVFLINGRPAGAETYATAALFRKLWGKGLQAAALEALGEHSSNARDADAAPRVDRAGIAVWLTEPHRRAARAKTSHRTVTGRVTLRTRETRTRIVFETLDAAQENRCVHATTLAQ